jgi:hypothetical protein
MCVHWEEQTSFPYVSAAAHPTTGILPHPRQRHLNRELGLDCQSVENLRNANIGGLGASNVALFGGTAENAVGIESVKK